MPLGAEISLMVGEVNIFRVGARWMFKHYFEEKEVFKHLSKYYNKRKYRFEVSNLEELGDVKNILRDFGYNPVFVEDNRLFQVAIDRYEPHAQILRNSVDSDEINRKKVFLMRDRASVEEALLLGAEPYSVALF